MKTLNSLKTEFPRFFPEHFQFECDNGWYDYIREGVQQLEEINEKLPQNSYIFADQIKEKFGLLRFYISHNINDSTLSNKAFDIADEIENKVRKAKPCETCGRPGKLCGRSWIKCFCIDHALSWVEQHYKYSSDSFKNLTDLGKIRFFNIQSFFEDNPIE